MTRARSTDDFDAWFQGLRDRVACRWIDSRIDRLVNGNAGSHRVLDGRLRELKIHRGSGYRVYYVHCGDTIQLLCGGDKRTQPADIARARRLLDTLE